tara:strand:+ start:5110 stop:5976 length:867 start_codon:yes stop_codon:yes gene_type:complete
MPIDYTSLLDGTSFTAEELNSRFTGAQGELNALTGESVALGGFRTEHVESPIGIAKEARDAVSGSESFVGYNSRDYATDGVGSYNVGDAITTSGTPTNPEVNFDIGIDLLDADQHINALVIMYNQFVLKFVTTATADGSWSSIANAADYGLFASFTPRLTFSDGESVEVPWATRAISPGFTQVPTTISTRYEGSAYEQAETSMKDVAIRAVITKDDIESLKPGTVRAGQAVITKVDISVNVYAFGISSSRIGELTDTYETLADNVTVRLHKGNLTVIPIQAGVVENIG